LLAVHGHAGEKPLVWPQFRGPNGSGVAENQKPPIEFGPDKNVKWKVKAPGGYSSPIVAGDLLVITAFEDGKLFTIAYRRSDGKEAWRAEAPAKKLEIFHKTESSPAASTSATDGKHIVSYFGSCGLFCYDLTGKELWKYEMPTAVMFGNFGSGVSPIIADGKVILQRDVAKEPKIMAIDVESGSLAWEKPRLSMTSYGTPVMWGKQIVTTGHGKMIAYDLKNGAEKWSVSSMPAGCCNSAVLADDTIYFAGWSPGQDKDFKMPTFDELLKLGGQEKVGFFTKETYDKGPMKGFFEHHDMDGDGKITRKDWDLMLKFMNEGKSGAFAVKAGGKGEITKSHVLWKATKGVPHVTTAIVYRGQIVMVKDGGIVTAYDAKSGEQEYLERAVQEGSYYASPVAANEHIYFTSLADGVVTVLKAGGKTPEVAAKNPKLGERVSATPAIADDAIYIRTAGHLYAFAERK
jgi:outer membrane protein assembly factor BamB